MGWQVGQRLRLQQDHRPPARAALKVRAGELVTLDHNDETWPAFIWTENADGVGGWVPERHLRRTGEGDAAEVMRDYDTTELSADADAVIAVVEVDEESGWLLCRADNGETGWVPVTAFEPADQTVTAPDTNS
jgi:SH3 domain